MKIFFKCSLALITILTPFILYHFSISEPDVRYTLSENIPLSFIVGTPLTQENIQQIEVKNIGSKQATNILLKLSGQVSNHEIQKHKTSDTATIYNKNNYIELSYPELPPQAVFRLIFKSAKAINYSDIVISHDSGLAKEALSDKNNSIALIMFWMLYITVIVAFVWLFCISTIKFKYLSITSENVINIQKPWYVYNKLWAKMHVDIITERMSEVFEYNLCMIDKSVAYILLNSDKKEYFNQNQWDLLIQKAIFGLEKLCTVALNSYDEEPILLLINTIRPKGINEAKWDSIIEKAHNKYIGAYELKRRYSDTKELSINNIPEDLSVKLKKSIQIIALNRFLENLEYSIDFLTKNLEIEIFNNGQKALIEGVLRVKQLEIIFKQLIADPNSVNEKPQYISDDYWDSIIRFKGELLRLNDLDKLQKELIESQKHFNNIKDKVLKQLCIINDLINDPLSFDRIESYDDTFSNGNYINLKRISHILRSGSNPYISTE